MKQLKALFNFYINSSIHVSLAVVALTFITIVEFNIPEPRDILLLNFFASIIGYNFIKYFEIFKIGYFGLSGWNKMIQILSIISLLFTVFFLVKINTVTQVIIGLLAMITLFYTLPILPKGKKAFGDQNLREIGGLKVFIISLVWAVTVVILPITAHKSSITFEVIVTFFQRFMFVLVLMIPFEIRDLVFDDKDLGTIPQRLGIKKSKRIGVLVVLLILLGELTFKDFNFKQALIQMLILAITIIFILKAKTNQTKYYSAFWVESIPIMWLGMILLFG